MIHQSIGNSFARQTVDTWFPRLGLPETRQHGGTWQARATWPADKKIWTTAEAEAIHLRMALLENRAWRAGREDQAEAISSNAETWLNEYMVSWPAHFPHGVLVDSSGSFLLNGMERLEWKPIEFVALAKGLKTETGDLDKAAAADWIFRNSAEGAPMDNPFPFTQVGVARLKKPEFLVDGLIETETFGVFFGDPGCGKSFLVADLGLSVATGLPFHGRDVKQGPVFFIAGEGHNGLLRRFHAWAKHQEVSIAHCPMFISERAAAFLDRSGAAAVIQTITNMAAYHGEPALVIIDTLARNFGEGDENHTPDMNKFVRRVSNEMVRLFPGCVGLVVHHTGHGEKHRARGNMALKAACDFEFRVEKNGPSVILTSTKMKDAEEPPPQHFTLTPVQLAEGISSAVLVSGETPPEPRNKIPPIQRLALDCYNIAARRGAIFEGGKLLGIHLETWRQAFYAEHTGDTTEAKKKAFQRARMDLQARRAVTAKDDIYLIRDPAAQLAIVMDRDNRDKPGHVPL